MSASHAPRLDNLDLLRAAAILLVVLFHAPSFLALPDGMALRVVQGWWSGVDLFFVLSGFLVGGLFWTEYAQRGAVNPAAFIGRRVLRTVPPYLVALHLIYLSRWIAGARVDYDPAYLVFLQNYRGMPTFSVSWSLCIEEHFYLLAPFLLLLAAHAKRPSLMLLLFPIPLLSRLLTTDPHSPSFDAHYYATHNHFEALLLGVWLAYARSHRAQLWRKLGAICRWAIIPSLGFVVAYNLLGLGLPFQNAISYTVFALAYGVILVYAASTDSLRIARLAATRFFAREAFSLYLTHTYCLLLFQQYLAPRLAGFPWPVHLAVALASVFLAGHVFYLAVERPVLRYRERLLGRAGPSKAGDGEPQSLGVRR
jgi:peptidoglycan/LPS O-acetylase OafA/YrhL